MADLNSAALARVSPLYDRVKRFIPPPEWATFAEDVDAILELKRSRNAVVLAHNYQTPEIFHGVADIVGDSLLLAREATKVDADIIVLAGVHFMAETAKLVNPEKTVLIPDLAAGCSLADSIAPQDVRLMRQRYPGVPVVTYVNTSSAVKAESDICCTSGNALKVVESLGAERVIMLPDEYLAQNIAALTNVKIIAWKGHCEVHELFTASDVRQLRENHPDVTILAHPECPPEVVAEADFSGSTAALQMAPERVLLLSKAPLGAEASSLWAQGGLAAAMGGDDDPAMHLADTLAAGAGLCDEAVARRIVHAAPAAVEHLARLGVAFDQRPDGGWRLGLEAAHGRNRIVHATGDGTGREIMRALIAAVRRCTSVTLLEGVEARSLIVEDNAIKGVLAVNAHGSLIIETGRVVIATGGIGGLFLDSTNPAGCFRQGLALAAHAGAKLSDLEFVQFHPTAFDGPSRPMPLLTEAVRGDGAILIDDTGQRFMADQPGAELAPRDIVARAVWRQIGRAHV